MRILNYKMNTNLKVFLTAYTAKLEASIVRLDDWLFRRVLNTKIDLTCIDRIKQGIQNDQARFDKLCKVIAKCNEDNVCCICLDGLATVELSCCHKLCPYCSTRVNKCPLCRKATGLQEFEGWTLQMPRHRETAEKSK